MSGDPKTVLTRLKTLCSAVENRAMVGKDKTVLTALTKFLSNENQEIVHGALEIVHMLSTQQGNEAFLARQPGMVHFVKKYMIEYLTPASTKKLASDIYANLQDYLDQVPPLPKEYETSVNLSSSSSQPSYPVESDVSASMAFFSSKTQEQKNSTGNTFVLTIATLRDEASRKEVESALLGMRGVVSFLLDPKTHQATVRYMRTLPELVSAVEAKGLRITASNETNQAARSKENMPEYLPENDSNGANKNGWFGSLVLWGSTPKKAPAKKQQSGWFGGISETIKQFY